MVNDTAVQFESVWIQITIVGTHKIGETGVRYASRSRICNGQLFLDGFSE